MTNNGVLYDVPWLVREHNERRMSAERHKLELFNQAVADDYFVLRSNGCGAPEARCVVAEKHGISSERVYVIVKWFFNQARKRRKYDFLEKFEPLEEH